MMKKLLFMLLLVSTVANSANREQRESRLVSEICSDVPSLTSVQTDSIAVAVSLYFTQLQTANEAYPTEVKQRISLKMEAEQVFLKTVERIMTPMQWQQWSEAKELRQQQIVEQLKH